MAHHLLLVVALAAFVCSAVLSATTTNVVILDMCKSVTASDWEFWLWGCWLP